MRIRRILLPVFAALAIALNAGMLALTPAQAQYRAIAACPGAVALQPAGSSGAIALVDVNGNLCISGTITPSGTQNVTGTGTAGAAAAGVVTVQGIAGMVKLLVTPDSVALPANQSVNLSQIAGAAPSLANPLWVFPATGATFPVSIAAAPLLPIGITPTDRTITSASGASQTLMSANASRRSLTVVNTGNANCGVNPTGGTAALGGAGTITLSPLGSYAPRVPTLSAVTVICTAAQPIYGDES